MSSGEERWTTRELTFDGARSLHVSFYGLAYTPKNALEEYGCGTTLANVTEDIQLISQLTSALSRDESVRSELMVVVQQLESGCTALRATSLRSCFRRFRTPRST